MKKKIQTKKIQTKKFAPKKVVSKSDEKTKRIAARIFTVGHSTRSAAEFVELLQSYKLKLVVDVRKIPKSRHNPQFWGDRLCRNLKKNGIEYIALPRLAGRRPPQKNSINDAWRNRSFQGYADYMQTDEFQKGLKRLISLSKRKRLVIMCAEAVPWRCHRSLIADALLAREYSVSDIFTTTNSKPHRMTPFAKIKGDNVTYPK